MLLQLLHVAFHCGSNKLWIDFLLILNYVTAGDQPDFTLCMILSRAIQVFRIE